MDYNDPNDPYGVSDGYDYNLDMWADDDGYQDAFDLIQSTGEGGGGYQGNDSFGFDDDNYSDWGDEDSFDDDFGDDSFWNTGGTVYRNDGGRTQMLEELIQFQLCSPKAST